LSNFYTKIVEQKLRASQGEKLAIFQIWREEEEVLSHLDNSSAHAPIG
jgi:hypothetical protein